MISALLFTVAAFGATICFQENYGGATCQPKEISCDNLEAKFPADEVSYYRSTFSPGGEFANSTIVPVDASQRSGSLARVYMGTFASTEGPVREIRSEGFATCSSVILLNSDCGKASLSHFIKVPPEKAFSVLKKEFFQSGNCAAREKNTEAVLMLSSRLEKNPGLDVLTPEGYYYRKLICEALKNFSHVRVISSKKEMWRESDTIVLAKKEKEFSLKFIRVDGNAKKETKSSELLFPKKSQSREPEEPSVEESSGAPAN